MRGIAWFIGVLLYLAACLATLVFVSLPLALFAAGAGLAGGLVCVLALAAVVLLRGSADETAVCPPELAEALRGRVRDEHVRRDRAWPQYFVAQARLDGAAIRQRVGTANRLLWAMPSAWLSRHELTVWWPLYVLVVVAQVTGSAGLFAGTAAVLGIITVLTGVAWAVGLPVVFLLRAADAGWQRLNRATASCQHCFQLSAVPAYRCRGNHDTADRISGYDLHRDLRPGRLGVLWRRCGCGDRLPTMVLRAAFSSRLEAACPRCGAALPRGSAVLTDVRIPVLGAASAGKTEIITAALVTLRGIADQGRIKMSFPERRSRQAYETYATTLRQGLPAAKTEAGSPPVAVTVRLDRGGRRALLHMFDAAGEIIVDREHNAELSYLDFAHSLMFVLDPFSVRVVRDECAATFPDVLEQANAAVHDPEDSYQAPVTRLHDYGVRTDRQRLAFVVSKADLLAKLPSAPAGSSSGQVRQWLVAQGLDNLVVCAERDFETVRFFLVDGRKPQPDQAFAPVDWLMTKEWTSVV